MCSKKVPILIDLLVDVYHYKHSSKRCEELLIVLKDFDGIAQLESSSIAQLGG